MSALTIETVDVEANRLTCTVSVTGTVSRFLADDTMWVRYDRSIESVPEGVAPIPVLAQLLPVAWAAGADVTVPVLDERFAEAIPRVRRALCEMHDFLEGGSVTVERRERYDPDHDDGCGLLFTGGVDSTASYVRHQDREPTLIAIRGWTITPDERDDDAWEAMRSRLTTFAERRSLETAFVESNMLRFLDHPLLLAHYKRHVDGAWYSSVGHGLGLTGLCAPLAYVGGMADLYVAATHWEGIDLAWGSRPDVDDAVAWSGTDCHHDGYHLTRQERIDRIAAYVDASSTPLSLHTCNERFDTNCGRCEKCYRTAVGLRLAGVDPNELDYRFDDADYDAIRRAFENGDWVIGEDERYMWEDIQDRAREVEPETGPERSFFEWITDVDFADCSRTTRPPLHHRMLRAGARSMPPSVYRRLYPIWRSVSSVGGR